jgi:pimeloyl-ACP methyl ester carboxylesterase
VTGTYQPELRLLVESWAHGFDWRAAETAINQLPSQVAELDGTPVRYLRFDPEGDDPLPIVLTHGWPCIVLELVTLARRLSAPSHYGGHSGDGFTVVVPAPPGFPFSPQRPTMSARTSTHELWHRLMHRSGGGARLLACGVLPGDGAEHLQTR